MTDRKVICFGLSGGYQTIDEIEVVKIIMAGLNMSKFFIHNAEYCSGDNVIQMCLITAMILIYTMYYCINLLLNPEESDSKGAHCPW